MGRGQVAFEVLDARPFLEDRDDVRSWGVLGRDAGGMVDRGAVLDAALLGQDEGDDLAELGQEGLAAPLVELDDGDDVNQRIILSRTWRRTLPRGLQSFGARSGLCVGEPD